MPPAGKGRFQGALLGGAIGDALGFPFEGCSRNYLRALGRPLVERFERHRSGFFPAGQYSDDTQMTLATVEAILDRGAVDGAAIAANFMALWRENRIIGRSAACDEAVQRLLSGAATWRDAGAAEGRAGNGAAMRAAPIGLWDWDDARQLVEDIAVASRITHRDRRAVAGAAAVAAAVAYNACKEELILDEFLAAMAGAVRPFDPGFVAYLNEMPRFLSRREEEALAIFGGLGLASPYRESTEGITPFVVPTVLAALYYFLRSPSDFQRTVQGALSAGGDVDTVGAIAGALSGALNGVEEIPLELTNGVVNRARILKLGERLYTMSLAK
ncbi:MAG: ADP-ribosylglycohydrolase family protein [Planctomycetes bacterium]|nr:ADP-ribosylglycohydrolase family protein [Planctomycetota bacterium]